MSRWVLFLLTMNADLSTGISILAAFCSFMDYFVKTLNQYRVSTEGRGCVSEELTALTGS